MYITTMISCQPTPLLPVLALSCPFYMIQPFFYLLGDPASFARGANTHPHLSLVCYQLFSPCCFTHPKAPHRSSYIFTQMTTTTSAIPYDTPTSICAIFSLQYVKPRKKQDYQLNPFSNDIVVFATLTAGADPGR